MCDVCVTCVYLKRPEERVGFSGAVVTSSCKPPKVMCWEPISASFGRARHSDGTSVYVYVFNYLGAGELMGTRAIAHMSSSEDTMGEFTM